MSNLVVRMHDEDKGKLVEAAKRAGLVRSDESGLTGNASLFVNLLAQSLPQKTAQEIKDFLGLDKSHDST